MSVPATRRGGPLTLETKDGGLVSRMPVQDALGLGAEVWDTVVARAGSPSPFMSWAWHRAWADWAPASEIAASEVLVLHGADGLLQALLPVRTGRMPFRRVNVRAVSWAIGDVGCPDELDVPALPDADMSALAAALELTPWQILVFGNLVDGAPHVQRLCRALVARGHTARTRPLWRCPQLELPVSWDDYLAALSSNRRQILRRKERSLRRDHAVALTDYDVDHLDTGWGHLLALHERRWDGAGGGAFREPWIERLQRQFAGEMARQKRLWLTSLDVDGQPAAVWYGFTADRTVYFYQGGRDPRWERESVGLVLMGVMIQRAIERGYRWFNFLRGDEAYKQQWTSSSRSTGEMVVFRSGIGGRLLRALDGVAGLRRTNGDV